MFSFWANRFPNSLSEQITFDITEVPLYQLFDFVIIRTCLIYTATKEDARTVLWNIMKNRSKKSKWFSQENES